MYHRYMPTENGQYRRKTIPDAPAPKQSPPPPLRETDTKPHNTPPPPLMQGKPPASEKPPPAPQAQTECCAAEHEGQNHIPILEKLLPGMDSGDILVLLILLFLLSEGNEDSTGVIMTLAIFLFLQ